MKIINEIFDNQHAIDMPFPFYFENMRLGVFDIETTGLNPSKTQLILSGFIIPMEDGSFNRIQVFAETLEDEEAVLSETLKILETLDVVVTYNGASFDIPFVLRRCEVYDMNLKTIPYNLDIYKIVRSHSEIGKFTPNLKQKTVENYMGLYADRADTISGKESVDLYYHYLNSGDINAQKKILLHNSDDIMQLYRLLAILRQTHFHKSMCALGFPIRDGIVQKIKLNKQRLYVEGTIRNKDINYTSYDDDSGYTCDFNKGKFEINLELINEDVLVFVDLNKLNAPLHYFKNCGALVNHYLILVRGDEVEHRGVTTIVKYLTERIVENELC